MQVERSGKLKYLLQVYARETTFGDKKDHSCSPKLMAQKHLEHQIKDLRFKARHRDEDRPALGAPSKGKAKGKGKDNAKSNPE